MPTGASAPRRRCDAPPSAGPRAGAPSVPASPDKSRTGLDCGIQARRIRAPGPGQIEGGPVIDRHARPALGVHAIQLEIDRRCYLDEALREPGPGFQRLAGFIEALAVELGEALLGRQVAMAAE